MIKPFLVTTLLISLCSALIACESEFDATSQTPSLPRPVKTFTVSAANNEKSLSLPAVIEAINQSQLSFQVDGVLTKLEVAKGATVKKGDMLAKLDQTKFLNALARAEADLQLAKANYAQMQTLAENNTIARATLDERRAAYDSSIARLNSAQRNLDNSVLRAPYNAVVADFHVKNFETVRANTPIATLQTAGSNYAVVQIPASIVIFAEQITIIAAYLQMDAAPSINIPAKMEDYASLADPVTQTYEMRFSFPSQESLNILPGMTATLKGRYTMTSQQSNPAFKIPLAAVVADADKTFVWVVKPDNTVSRRDVQIAPNAAGKPEAISGLMDGETIVAAGATYLFEGASIRRYRR